MNWVKMSSNGTSSIVTIDTKSYIKRVILADVNIPYKFTIDRDKNKLFFCINAEEFSDQSFQSVILDLNSGGVSIIPSMRNGFASAIDVKTGTVYLGGSNGIYRYNYQTNDIDRPAIINRVDVFDMYFNKYLYFVDTANLDLHFLKNTGRSVVANVEEYGIHHFVVDNNGNIILANTSGLFYVSHKAKSPVTLSEPIDNIRGITFNKEEKPYVIAQNGIYLIDPENDRIIKILTLNNGYGLAFDNNNNIVYSDERSVVQLIPL